MNKIGDEVKEGMNKVTNKAMVGGKTIAKELKNDVKNQMKN